MSLKSRKLYKQNKRKSISKSYEQGIRTRANKHRNTRRMKRNTRRMKRNTRRMKRNTRKMNGGFINVSDQLNRIRESIKTKFLKILMTGQSPEIQDKIKSMMENDSKFKKMNLKIDLFMDRVETLIQNFIQTATTTTIKVTTSWMPGVSFLGALITTAINWTVLCVKSASRGYDFYKIYSEMQEVIEEQGGKKMDLSARVGNLQKEAIAKVANTTVPSQISSKMKSVNIQNQADEMKQKATEAATKNLENISGKTTSQLQAKADEMKQKAQSKADEMKQKAAKAAMKNITPGSVAKLASVGNNLAK